MIQVAKLGSNPTMRHIGRVHGISVSFMHQEVNRTDTSIGHLDSKMMAADIHTKAYPDSKVADWNSVRRNVCVFSPDELKYVGSPGKDS